ncbi:c-type cytochrome [Maribacter algarum]|uniref:C-type cytochrome n=1 Tax=Maribacter algarum (ex Zhang et al. 2020) TaxID=2578118 RepID=A0A5S3PSP2_9FLAO|nr:c-type cytochrome [Maribacter algarum]TMM57918.1 c-type cytochrome [Maribacter algarum]
MRFIISVLLFCILFSCQTSFEEPVISLDGYQIEDGFELELIASEPLLEAPVAMDFDAKGRIWVAQMPGYMNDMQGSDEDKPVGSIKILEDLDNDGVVDRAKIFLDSLVMPRALAHVYGGLLYAEPPFLYFVDIENDKPVNRIVVDSIYAADGNPEHQPNGLLLNIDNWIYNAKSNFRYQRKNGVWKKEPTTFRGQWGISHDNFGRLYYNNNSQQLLGDHVLPNRLIRNKHFTPKAGVNRKLTDDQRVYPLHATAVNRGYAPGVLTADSVLVNTTAAAGLMVYRGGVFPEGYDQNVFVSIPEGNLIKRNILTFTGDSTIAKQAWEGKEFLASTDEGFRPVTLKNGPDGSMYIVDMHRGIIGHHAYLSPYFKKKTEENRLDTLTNFGRILKVKQSGSIVEKIPNFDGLSGTELIEFLKHKNGWIRSRAQHYLIFKEKKEVLSELKDLALNSENELAQIHALNVLEGWDTLDFDFLAKVAKSSSSDAAAHAIVLLEQFATKENWSKALSLFKEIFKRDEVKLDLYISSTLGKWMPYEGKFFFHQAIFILKKYKENPIVQEAMLSSFADGGEELLRGLNFLLVWEDEKIIDRLENTIKNKEQEVVNPIFSRKFLEEDNRTVGGKMYLQICAACHGANGEGIDGLAPPLMNSEHVADAQRLGLIILHGLQGPVSVNGQEYEFNLAMPGLIRNETISDKDIADVMAYVTNAFSDIPTFLNKDEVSKLRAIKPKSGAEYTEQELKEFSKKHGSEKPVLKIF